MIKHVHASVMAWLTDVRAKLEAAQSHASTLQKPAGPDGAGGSVEGPIELAKALQQPGMLAFCTRLLKTVHALGNLLRGPALAP